MIRPLFHVLHLLSMSPVVSGVILVGRQSVWCRSYRAFAGLFMVIFIRLIFAASFALVDDDETRGPYEDCQTEER